MPFCCRNKQILNHSIAGHGESAGQKKLRPTRNLGKYVMKTKFWNLLLVQMLLVCSVVSFASCSSDDDDDIPTSTIVGTWKCDDIDGYSVQFNADFTGREMIRTDGNAMDGAFEYSYNKEKAELTIIGTTEKMYMKNGTYKANVAINKMTLGGLNFTKQ